MRHWLRYLAAAFNARPFGMPVPPNWFLVAAALMLGTLANPGFLAIGAGIELFYLGSLVSSKRFRNLVDATKGGREQRWQEQREQMLGTLPTPLRKEQERLEEHCSSIAARLQELQSAQGQIDDLARLCWLHLRLLVSRLAVAEVVDSGERESGDLHRQEARLVERLESGELEPKLRSTLEEQWKIVRSRREAHADARGRLEVIDAELERIRQQAALVHERALLANDAGAAADSVDVIAASLNEADRWLSDQQALLGGMDELFQEPPDGRLFELKQRQ